MCVCVGFLGEEENLHFEGEKISLSLSLSFRSFREEAKIVLSNGEKLGREEGVLKFDKRAVAVSDVCVFLS